jgi:hypothetical protein
VTDKDIAKRLLKLAKQFSGAEPKGYVSDADVSIELESSQYWRGCGSGRHDYAASGLGFTPAEAYDDALDVLFQGDYDYDLDERQSMRVLDRAAGRIKREKRSEIPEIIRENLDIDPDDFETQDEYEDALEEAYDEALGESELYYYVCIQFDVEAI